MPGVLEHKAFFDLVFEPSTCQARQGWHAALPGRVSIGIPSCYVHSMFRLRALPAIGSGRCYLLIERRTNGCYISGKAERPAARGGRAWRRPAGRQDWWPAADHRRRRFRKDEHAGPSRRASDRQWRRSAPYPADDLFTAGRIRDGASRAAHLPASAWRQRRHHDRRARLGRDVPWHRCAALADVCRADRPQRGFHNPRPRGFRGPDEPRSPRAGLFVQADPVSHEEHLHRDLFPRVSIRRSRSRRS